MSSEKIAVLTRRAGYNYGSTLQAYAMQHLVNSLGYDATIVDYDELYHNWRWRVRPAYYNRLTTLSESFPGLFKFFAKAKYEWLNERYAQMDLFDRFEKNYMKLTPVRLRTSKEIGRIVRDYDTVLCGSDQIWSPLLYDPVYFLDFVKAPIKKVAYAPSIGVGALQSYCLEIKEHLSTFDAISVREATGAKELSRLIGKNVPVVADPTLMVGREVWEQMERPVEMPEQYILTYFLGEEVPEAYIEQLQRAMGLPVYAISTYYTPNKLTCATALTAVAPEEFLWLIHHAAYVCTDSFHGTIFSTIYEKPFYTFERFHSEDRGSQNSRIYDLLAHLGLQQRIVKRAYYQPLVDIDFEKVAKNVEQFQLFSTQYLSEALAR